MTPDQDSRSLLRDLISRDLQYIQHWLQNAWLGRPSVPDDFNWLGLAEACASNARSNVGDVKMSLSWAKVAISIYDMLAGSAAPVRRDSAEMSGMMLRASSIQQYGSIPGDAVLDAGVIVDWFRETVGLTYQEATDLVRSRPTLTLDQLRQLRRVKNKLNVIEGLSDCRGFNVPEDIRPWIALHKDLP